MHQISVWFVCKLCRSSFQTVPDWIKHKFENHFGQFKPVKHIIFEEKFYDGDFDFPDGYRDHLTKSKPFDEGQVYEDRLVNNTIQRPTLPPINSTYIKPVDSALLEHEKAFTLSSNSDLLDNIDSRTVSFTIEQDSVIINVGTLNNLNSTAAISERIPRPFDMIGKENKVRDAPSMIQNPFVLLKRLSPQDIENSKLGNGTVTKFNQSCSSSDFVSHIDSIDLDFDQLSETSQKGGTTSDSDCENEADLDVKPFQLDEEITLSDQTLSTGHRQKCKNVFQHSFQTFLSSDKGNGDTSASSPVLAAVPANCTANFEKSQLSQNIGQIFLGNSAKNSLKLGEESTIFYQKQFACPRPKCKMSFRKKPYLTTHLNYYHGDLERRRLIASGYPPYGSNNDKMDINNLPVPGTHSDCNIKETKTSTESVDSDENQRCLQIKKVICDMYADNSLKHVQTRAIGKQTHFTCPRQNCNTVFNGITSLKHHLNYSHGDLERRRLIASGCQTCGSNDDDKNGRPPELAPAVMDIN